MPPKPRLALGVHGLAKEYADLVALQPLDLEIPQGARVALIGHNGSGKTTLLRLAAGVLEPTEGSVKVLGYAAGTLGARAALSYLPDTPVLYDDLSVAEHIEYTAGLHFAQDWEERAVSLLKAFGLAERADDLPARFSRGLRQKTAIILALIRPFDLFMVDEPFVGLDAAGRQAFERLLDEASAGGSTLVVATHQLDFAARVERCIALRDGQLIYDGPPSGADLTTLVG